MRKINQVNGCVVGAKPSPALIKRFKKLIEAIGVPESRYQESWRRP